MFKKVPQDQVTQRVFKVFKDITINQDDVTVFSIQDHEGPYDEETDVKSKGFSERALYNSLKHKYYNKNLSLLQYGGGFSTQQDFTGQEKNASGSDSSFREILAPCRRHGRQPRSCHRRSYAASPGPATRQFRDSLACAVSLHPQANPVPKAVLMAVERRP